MRRYFLVIAMIAICVIGCAPQNAPVAPPAPVVLSIGDVPSHVLKGWGIFPCTIRSDRPRARDFTIFERPNAQKLLFGELGMTVMRCEILPGSYDAKRDDGSLDTQYLDSSLVRQMQIARRFGIEKTLLSIWSPPAVFKEPPTTFGTDPKTKRISQLRPARELDYCRFIVRVLDYLTKTKKLAAPLAFSIQNEPSYAAQQWNGTRYEPAQWRRVFVLMRRVLDENGYRRVALIGPECGSYQESVDFMGGAGAPVFRDAKFRDAMSGFAFHGYTRFSRKEVYARNLQSVVDAAARLGKDVWMSEYSIVAQKPDRLQHALETAQRLAREMTFVRCNYWFWWQGWYPVHPKNEVLISGRDDDKLHVSKTYDVLKKLWHSAPAGSKVFRVASSDTEIKGYDALAVQTVAFVDENRTTLLVTNPTGATKTLHVRGLKGTVAMPFLTDATRDMKAQETLAIKNGGASLVLAPRAILILTTR